MHRGFPVRVNRKDADRHFNSGFVKKPDSDIKIFKRGARHYLHPSLSILDRVDCELVYYKNDKVIVVSYDAAQENIDNTDYTQKVYRKCVMSGDVDYIVDILNDYMNDRKAAQQYNTQINSDAQSEPIDITTEDYPV